MPTQSTDQHPTPIPSDAGLPSGRSSAGGSETPRNPADLVDAAVRGEALGAKESDDLLAYYLSNDALPGDADALPVTVELGHGAKARKFACEIHPIEWSEWQDARERATDQKTGEFDAYVSASWIVARALITPKLGPTVRLQQEAAKADDGKGSPPTDAADLLRRMFRRQSGSLLELSGKVLEISKLQNDNESVKEVEAGKA